MSDFEDKNYEGLGMGSNDQFSGGSYGHDYGGYGGHGGHGHGGHGSYEDRYHEGGGSRFTERDRYDRSGRNPLASNNDTRKILITTISMMLIPILLFVIDWKRGNNDEKRIDNEYKTRMMELDDPAKKIRDSLLDAQHKLETEMALSGYLEIYQLMYKLRDQMPNATHISVFKIHDHGGILNTAEPQFLTILYTTDFDEEIPQVDIKKDWQARELYVGIAWYAEQIKNNGYFYMPDAMQEPNFWVGATADYARLIGTRAMAGAYIKGEVNSMYFISASFRITKPLDVNPNVEIYLRNAQNVLRRLINPASENLPTKRFTK